MPHSRLSYRSRLTHRSLLSYRSHHSHHSRLSHLSRRSHRSRRIVPPQWHDPMVDMLIDERERRNVEYHSIYRRSRQNFWESVARRYILFYVFFKKES